MSVKRSTLDGLQSLDELYDRLTKQLKLPAHFGRNLDALWDVLSTDVEGPIEIVWKDTEKSRKHMGRDYSRVIKIFQKLEKERDDFRLIIER